MNSILFQCTNVFSEITFRTTDHYTREKIKPLFHGPGAQVFFIYYIEPEPFNIVKTKILLTASK